MNYVISDFKRLPVAYLGTCYTFTVGISANIVLTGKNHLTIFAKKLLTVKKVLNMCLSTYSTLSRISIRTDKFCSSLKKAMYVSNIYIKTCFKKHTKISLQCHRLWPGWTSKVRSIENLLLYKLFLSILIFEKWNHDRKKGLEYQTLHITDLQKEKYYVWFRWIFWRTLLPLSIQLYIIRKILLPVHRKFQNN